MHEVDAVGNKMKTVLALVVILVVSLIVVSSDKPEAYIEKKGQGIQFYESRYAPLDPSLLTEIGKSVTTELGVIRTARRLDR